jgi:hypothetical protein
MIPSGQAGFAWEKGQADIGGKIAVNPSGGLKSKGHPIGATGAGQVYEIVKQLRGDIVPADNLGYLLKYDSSQGRFNGAISSQKSAPDKPEDDVLLVNGAGLQVVSAKDPSQLPWRAMGVDVVIANAENAAAGFGITPGVAEELFGLGIALLTSGNHVWDKKEIESYLVKQDRLIRPANYPEGNPGYGSVVISTVAGMSHGDGETGPAGSALLFEANDVAIGPQGALFIADSGHSRVRKVSPTGEVSNVAGNGQRHQGQPSRQRCHQDWRDPLARPAQD